MFLPLKDIDIKKVNGIPQYAFVQYSDIGSVCKAIKKMDAEYLGNNRLKVVILSPIKKEPFLFCVELFTVYVYKIVALHFFAAWFWEEYTYYMCLA